MHRATSRHSQPVAKPAPYYYRYHYHVSVLGCTAFVELVLPTVVRWRPRGWPASWCTGRMGIVRLPGTFRGTWTRILGYVGFNHQLGYWDCDLVSPFLGTSSSFWFIVIILFSTLIYSTTLIPFPIPCPSPIQSFSRHFEASICT